MTPQKCKWFGNCVGIVLTQDDEGNESYYIGAGNGLNEIIDINNIIARGSPFPRDAGDLVFGRVRGVVERPPSTEGIPRVVPERRTKKGRAARPVGEMK